MRARQRWRDELNRGRIRRRRRRLTLSMRRRRAIEFDQKRCLRQSGQRTRNARAAAFSSPSLTVLDGPNKLAEFVSFHSTCQAGGRGRGGQASAIKQIVCRLTLSVTHLPPSSLIPQNPHTRAWCSVFKLALFLPRRCFSKGS